MNHNKQNIEIVEMLIKIENEVKAKNLSGYKAREYKIIRRRQLEKEFDTNVK